MTFIVWERNGSQWLPSTALVTNAQIIFFVLIRTHTNTTWGLVIYDRISIFGWIILFDERVITLVMFDVCEVLCLLKQDRYSKQTLPPQTCHVFMRFTSILMRGSPSVSTSFLSSYFSPPLYHVLPVFFSLHLSLSPHVHHIPLDPSSAFLHGNVFMSYTSPAFLLTLIPPLPFLFPPAKYLFTLSKN